MRTGGETAKRYDTVVASPSPLIGEYRGVSRSNPGMANMRPLEDVSEIAGSTSTESDGFEGLNPLFMVPSNN
jgi:hypothetical protein